MKTRRLKSLLKGDRVRFRAIPPAMSKWVSLNDEYTLKSVKQQEYISHSRYCCGMYSHGCDSGCVRYVSQLVTLEEVPITGTGGFSSFFLDIPTFEDPE